MGSIFFSYIVAPFKICFLYIETYSTVPKVFLDGMDANLLMVIAYYVTEFDLVF